MPIPSSINDLDVNPNNNSPQGAEAVGPNANGYLQAAFSFIRQLANGAGLKPTAPVNANGQRLTNLAPGEVSANSKDAVTGSQLRAVYKKGEVKMWHGAVANIASVWGAGWQLADGSNGTANLVDKFVVGAGKSRAPDSTGGNASVTLSKAQMPAHAHQINDNGHAHVARVSDPEHTHLVSDPEHRHSQLDFGPAGQSYFGNGTNNLSMGGGAGSFGFGGTPFGTSPARTGIGIGAAHTGVTVSIESTKTGITVSNTGSGAPIDILPPYYALCFIEFVGP